MVGEKREWEGKVVELKKVIEKERNETLAA
jgi:hypothetical protein